MKSGRSSISSRPLLAQDQGCEPKTHSGRFAGSSQQWRPNILLVLLFEDLHWSEERLLDFIEELVERGDDSPILALCLARPDLLEKRESWGAGRLDPGSNPARPVVQGEQ